MKVKLAKTAGFCMGVHRAMDLVLNEANKGDGPIYTYGPLIHNSQVIDLLKSKGVIPIEDIREIQGKKGTMVIRAHGIPPGEREILRSSGLRILDATCPRVARVQAIIRSHTRKGFTAVIVGDQDHPEVIGLQGYAEGKAHVIGRPEEVATLPETEKLLVVAQTTQDAQVYREIQEAVRARYPKAVIFDTICDATHNRQQEVKSFSGHVDCVVVVGGYHSGNTQRLVQVSEGAGLRTFHIEKAEELDRERLASMEVVGVTAGASTPNWMIKQVVQEIQGIRSRREARLGPWLRKVFKILMDSNLVVAFGGYSLSYSAEILMNRDLDFVHPGIAFLYIYAMHVLNRFLDKGASTYNDPAMACFYRRYRIPLMFSGILAILGSLAIAIRLGPSVFLIMSGLCVLGIIYSVPIVPLRRRRLFRYTKIKDIPGSKTLSESLAWATVISLVPLLEPSPPDSSKALVAFFAVFSIVYVRSALFDIFQAQGDLIVGVETLPITLGEKRTLLLLKSVTIIGGLGLLAAPLVGAVGSFSYLLLLCYGTLMMSILAYEKRWLYPGTSLEALVEGNFFLAGCLGFLWHHLA
ncbi:MAG: 4-hydroxy-3-methylbut-2-enyl diphosphate reductase [Deltaproteobacteria bacterium]|nr:4-hydroxy-3-methylbut-2-enyl diphosphate reductase [Deltaproteobacteria bacterium]MBW2128251.1 4-hydroxy-3-methylbut-2-enyl diphosphate reductase [Deltaproteobacteria bacterium]